MPEDSAETGPHSAAYLWERVAVGRFSVRAEVSDQRGNGTIHGEDMRGIVQCGALR